MKAAIVVAVVFAGTTAFVSAAQRVGQQPAPQSTTLTTPYRVSRALASGARVPESQALASARRYAPGVFTVDHPVTVRYGLVDLRAQEARGVDGRLYSIGSRDSWLITARGLDLPPFGTDPYAVRNHLPIPRYHTVTFVVDGQTGQVLQASWY